MGDMKRVCTECGESFAREFFPYTDRSHYMRGTICFRCCKSKRNRGEKVDAGASQIDVVEGQFSQFSVDQGLEFTPMQWEKVCRLVRLAKQQGLVGTDEKMILSSL
jgi:hypothetical protein